MTINHLKTLELNNKINQVESTCLIHIHFRRNLILQFSIAAFLPICPCDKDGLLNRQKVVLYFYN